MNFLNWLYLRLQNKYQEDQEVLHELKQIIDEYSLVKMNIKSTFIDDICKKHFVDFDMEKTPDLNFGFSEQDRCRYRNFVMDIITNISRS